MLVNPSRHTVLQDEPRSSAPFKTDSMLQEIPTLPSDALSKEQVGPQATEKSRGKKRKRNRRAEFDKFSRQWKSSEGFDVCHPPLDLIEGPCVFQDIKSMSSGNEYLKLALECVDFAIKNENKLKDSGYEYVELVKFNLDSVLGGKMYYLTFKAKDTEDREDVYQAKVFMPEEEEEEEVDVLEKYKEYIAQFKKPENDFADIEGEEEEEGESESESESESEEEEEEEEEEEDEDDDDDDDDDDEDEEEEYGKDRKVLIFRKRSSERQQSKGVEQKHGRGKKRCCGKGGRCCDGGSS